MKRKKFAPFTFPIGISEEVEIYGGKTIYLQLRGGLGNQLFIYFGGLYFAQKFKMKLVVDARGVDHGRSIRDLNLPGRFTTNRVFWKIVELVYSRQRVGEHEIDPCESGSTFSNKSFLLEGFFQNQFFFAHMIQLGLITEGMNFNLNLPDFKAGDSALIHIRGGDYLTHSEDIGCLGVEYYKKVFSIIREHSIRNVYIITDDEEYAKKLLGECKFTSFAFVESAFMSNLELLSCFGQFEYIFLANSTLSWWGAALSKSSTKVYAPNIWFKGDKTTSALLHRNDWLTVETNW